MAKPWVEADYRVHVTRGASTHLVAGWTGATKGLIGLHAFGLRPADQGADKIGSDVIKALGLLSRAGGAFAILGHRTGIPDIAERLLAVADDALLGKLKSIEQRWAGLQKDPKAWAAFQQGTTRVIAELQEDVDRKLPQQVVSDKMRWEMRKVLEAADAIAPGFKRDLWQVMHQVTRIALPIMARFREWIPALLRDEAIGGRIGLLSSLPYESDLVVQSQPKMGIGGGPDAYDEVRDVGHIVAGTDEMSCDAYSWSRAGMKDPIWSVNYPVYAALRYGHGPISMDEVKNVSGA
jgi:hypothetical protein